MASSLHKDCLPATFLAAVTAAMPYYPQQPHHAVVARSAQSMCDMLACITQLYGQ
jgi:hypothetical protein